MIATDAANRDEPVRMLANRLLDRRAARDHWAGHLSSSALSTATAVLALAITDRARSSATFERFVSSGTRWLLVNQNTDGGWGDTVRSRTNISTTVIAWAALSFLDSGDTDHRRAVARAESWLGGAAGGAGPVALRTAILDRYGDDRTFSVPILT
ncbi:MAG: hypothetical protein L0271_01620, partial [Gemmatimonadetes bacterium]|nr:hypothetical protein [Gemmatimonadota bacterium]